MSIHKVWLDCDPGHDDATAILLALHTSSIELLGISTVHGNTDATHTALNAARCLHAWGAPPNLRVYAGAAKPLLRAPRYDPEIHGADGLGGVVGLPSPEASEVRARIAVDQPAIEAIARAVREAEGKVVVVASGPLTNVALFVSAYPELLEKIEQIVFMGGGIGIGNRSPGAEWNILCDPEAAQIVLDAPIKTVMMPLNVTHKAIVTSALQARLRNPSGEPGPASPLRHTLATLVTFFADTYRSTFGFESGPPLHDALTIAYVAHPEFFEGTRWRVDVERAGVYTAGETIADVYGYRACDDTWGPGGKNCFVVMDLRNDEFFEYLLQAVEQCDAVSPLNHRA
ncbi:uridine nucleosidase [Vararia minispora EC-137]|uniref:Uridine nucleosidase n=1 Tax=Vararia minispora EC-137 TaxID=1314806 RepID=A0ACB8Q9H1_9AGAM|nr:uridine nucleosidase [Vararia minispora EC-137]